LGGDLSAVGGNLDRPGEKYDFANVRKYRKIDDAIRDRDIEAVDLCLPTHLHESAAIAALESGKHVLVEKPMALDGAACDRMLAAAEESGRIFMTAQVLRFWPDYQPLIDAQRSESLGKLCAALFRRRCAAPSWGKWLQDPAKGGGGVFDLLIHDVDMCIHLFGAPEAVSATGTEALAAGIDLITAQLHYPSAASVTITGGWHHPKSYPFSMEYTVSFEGGTLDYSSAGRPVTLHNSAGEAIPQQLPDKDGFLAEIEYFLECAAANRLPERCSPRESADAVRVCRLMAEARKHHGEKIPCRL
jgi:predicted dehydrogenase